jgi:beta-galactosidase
VIALRLDNSDNPDVPPGKPQNQLDFTYLGGLYRNV